MHRPLSQAPETSPDVSVFGFRVEWRVDAEAFSRIWGVSPETFRRGFISCCPLEELAQRQALLVPEGGGDPIGVCIAWRNNDGAGYEVRCAHYWCLGAS